MKILAFRGRIILFNPWWGCTKVSAGCDNCYAEVFDHRVGGDHWGKGVPRRVFTDKHWSEPLRWNKQAERDGFRHKVFCASMADVMDDEAPEGQRERLWKLIDETPHLIWQLLTKRPIRYWRYLPKNFMHHNVWLGTTTENQETYSSRIGYLSDAAFALGLPCFISYEPALGPVFLGDWIVDWVIFGGESGPNRRPMKIEWAENMRRECAQKGIPFFMKQVGGLTPEAGKKAIPEHLRIQEFPE